MPGIGLRSVLWATIALIAGTGFLIFSAFPAGREDDAGASTRAGGAPPSRDSYFALRPVGSWRTLPSDGRCAARVHRSTWEPRPGNARANARMPSRTAVHAAFAARPVAVERAYHPRWDTWLLQRVTGHFTGTTDEILQWAACKWGLPDNVLRAVAARESTWFQSEVYASRRCVADFGCGDLMDTERPGSTRFCATVSRFGHDYRPDYPSSTGGRCPRTFGITGVMSWQAPEWGRLRGNQNGTFPFNRNSTAFAADYLGSQLRGCYEGWEWWLTNTGTRDYRRGHLWGCVGAWYAGDWRSTAARGYVARVKAELAERSWLSPGWAAQRPPCDREFGCPVGSF